MPEDKPRAFSSLVQWLYTTDYDYDDDRKGVDHFILYALADKLQISTLKDQVVDALIAFAFDHFFSRYHIEFIYENTTKGSNLRKLACFQTLRGLEDNPSHKRWDAFVNDKASVLVKTGPDFYFDLFCLNRTLKVEHEEVARDMHCDDFEVPNCLFHEHGEEGYCKYRATTKRENEDENDEDEM